MSTYVAFNEIAVPARMKTRRWRVSSAGCPSLGGIGWFAPWRRYVFYPAVGTLYEETCLRDIAAFCEEQTREHKDSAP